MDIGLGSAIRLTARRRRTEFLVSVVLQGGVMEEFYRGFAQQARDLAEKADPFTRRRLVKLANRYAAQSKPRSSYGRPPVPRATPPASLFTGSGEA